MAWKRIFSLAVAMVMILSWVPHAAIETYACDGSDPSCPECYPEGGEGEWHECWDSDDHYCDQCGNPISECEDWDDHYCDICYNRMSECEDWDDHYCDLCYNRISECED